MAKVDQNFQDLCLKIKTQGREYENRNRGVKRLQIPSYTFRHNFSDGFPALTNKDLYWKGIVSELLWFLRGQTNIWYLKKDKVSIWDKDAYNQYKRMVNSGDINNPFTLKFEEFVQLVGEAESYEFLQENYSWNGYVLGDVGKNYSYQWRNFGGKTDQISNMLSDMCKDIMGSRIKVNAWNPNELDETALPPCHSEFQIVGVPLTFEERKSFWVNKHLEEMRKTAENFNVDSNYLDDVSIPQFGFELHWNQRSVDTFLGLPFNIASYGLLAKIIEHLTGYVAIAIEGTLKCVHFYDNQYLAVDTLLKRPSDRHSSCELGIFELPNTFLEFLDKATVKDFVLLDYSSDEAIKVEMLAPKE